MEREGKSIEAIKCFRNVDVSKVVRNMNTFIAINSYKLSLLNATITYDSEECIYVGIVAYHQYDRFSELKDIDEWEKELEESLREIREERALK